MKEYKDYMFFNADNGEYIWTGTSERTEKVLKNNCMKLLRQINKNKNKKITNIIAHETYTAVETKFSFSENEV